jgi:hypothetical protein
MPSPSLSPLSTTDSRSRALAPSLSAVISTTPPARAVTRPSALIVATAGLLEV